ncbi:unnamed protein product [Callosobruchus maculatus]|uniref:Uncharacterized protein n=1 Tax=Callosobruchus maculatus TaxID=64391 RepID=A0A653DM43_CALMS|nr:unnamed protein product [Callosobruchus maculatus]
MDPKIRHVIAPSRRRHFTYLLLLLDKNNYKNNLFKIKTVYQRMRTHARGAHSET